MKIGLIDIDSKLPNLALMKLSAYHKSKGDKTELTSPLFATDFDKIYASKVFAYSEMPILPKYSIIGGSGYNLEIVLDNKIEHIMPDYSLYPNVNYSLGFTTRGCIRKCPFCIVPQKEGGIKFNANIYEFWDNKHENIVLLDNAIFALEGQFKKISEQILKEGLKVDFNQGLDIRLLTMDMAKLLEQLKPAFPASTIYWRFAFDSLKYETQFHKGAKILLNTTINPRNIVIYCLCGFDEELEDDLKRVLIAKEYGFKPFAMPFNYTNTRKDFARWVNHKAIFESVKWENYKK